MLQASTPREMLFPMPTLTAEFDLITEHYRVGFDLSDDPLTRDVHDDVVAYVETWLQPHVPTVLLQVNNA